MAPAVQALKRGHVLVLGLILAEILVVIWYFKYLPMVDLPQHLFTAKVLTHYTDPTTAYDQFFTKKFPWNPYASYFWFLMALEPVIGVLNATRLYLSLGLVLTIVAFAMWLREVLPDRQALTVPATMLLLGLFFYVGLINYLFSIPFMFFSFALSYRLARKPEGKTEIALAFALLATYFSHVVTFAITLAVIGIQQLVVFRGRGLVQLIRASAPSTALMAFYTLFALDRDVVALSWSYEPLIKRFEYLLMPFNVFADVVTSRWIFQSGTIAFWSVFVIVAIAGGRAKGRAKIFPALLIAVLLVLSTLAFPTMIAESSGAPRLSYPAAFALLALLPVGWDARPVLRAIVVLLCVVHPLVFAYGVASFQNEMADLEKAIDAIPPHQAVQPVITDLHSAQFRTYPYLHIAAWYNYYKGGTNPYLFTHVPHFPIRERRRAFKNPPGEWAMTSFKYETHQEGTDYFLVRSDRPDVIDDLTMHVPLLVTSGEWKVFGPNPK